MPMVELPHIDCWLKQTAGLQILNLDSTVGRVDVPVITGNNGESVMPATMKNYKDVRLPNG